MKNILLPALLILLLNSCSQKSESIINAHDEKLATDKYWKKIQALDEFGDEIVGKKIISGIFKGKFSNEFVANETALLRFQVKDSISIFEILDYGNEPVKDLENYNLLPLTIKLSDGKIINDTVVFLNNMVISNFEGKLYSLLISEEKPFKIIFNFANIKYSKLHEFDKSSYLIEIFPQGLKELLENK